MALLVAINENFKLLSVQFTHCGSNVFNDEVFKEINTLCVWVLVISKAVHHAAELLAEEPLSA